MSEKRHVNSELMKKAEKIRKEMAARGESYHGIDELEEHYGPILGPRDDAEYRKLLEEIKKGYDEKE